MSTIKINVEGMSCAACAATVEKAAKSCEGVTEAEVQLLAGRLVIKTEGQEDAVCKSVCAAVTQAGYSANLHPSKKIQNESAPLKRRLILSLCLMLPLTTVAMLPMFLPLPQFLSQYYFILPLCQVILAILALGLHRTYLQIGFSRLFHLAPSMESLISVGVAASVLYSFYELYHILAAYIEGSKMPIAHLYFDSAVMILTLATLGKYLESISKEKTKKSLKGLLSLVPAEATVMREGIPVTLPASQIQKGDILLVTNGASIPADGIIVEGSGAVDTSAMTGESLPQTVSVGDCVKAGTVNRAGSFKIRAQVVGEQTTLASMIRMVEEASASKAPVARLADKVCGVFVPVILGISLVTALVWFMISGNLEFSLSCGVSVLVIACPCSLGLATPAAVMAGTGKGAEMGILYRNAEALEKAHRIDTCVFDKTGTVTEGSLQISDLLPLDCDPKTLLAYTLSCENFSDHPIAEAIKRRCEEEQILPLPTQNANETPGHGICVYIEGKPCYVGSEKYVLEKADLSLLQPSVDRLTENGKTAVYTVYDGKLMGAILLSDTIRAESKAVMELLHKQKIQTVLLTGDRQGAARAVADSLGIDQVYAEVAPADKMAVIQKLHKEGRSVAMIGDGINDAAALAEADVGISVGSGTDVAIEQSDIVLMKDDLRDIPAAISLSRSVMRVIKQNLFFAFFYNCVGVLFAAGVFYHATGMRANPMLAAAAMSASSLCVLSNALRLRHAKTDKILSEINTKTEKEIKVMKKTVKIEGMMCPHCQARVNTILSALAGVESVSVSLEDKAAYLTLSAPVDDATITKTITDNGYTVVGIE